MKKRNLFLTIALVIVAATVAFVSCKKEKQEQTSNKELSTSQLSEMDREMLAFGERLKSAEESEEVMPLKEAVRTLSNYQNFLLCDASVSVPDMICDTFEVMLPVSDGMAQLVDLKRLLDVNKANIHARFNTLDGNGKTIYCITSKILEEGSTEQSARIQTITLMHNGPTRDNPAYAVLFDSTDYWYDFGGLGKCGDYVGQCIGQDAVSKLQLKLREWLPMPTCACGRTYLTDHVQVTVLSIAYPDATSPNGYYAMPYNPNVNYPMCVSPEDMRWYYESIRSIYNDVEDADALGRKIISLSFNGTSGGGDIKLCALNLELYKVNCGEWYENGGD